MKSRGFTLIELMIVIVVIGILAAIAYPSYSRYVDRAAIADGKSALLSAAQQMERCFTRFDRYANESGEARCPIRGSSDENFYTISFSGDATTYLLTADAAGSRPTNPVECQTLILNQLGQRGSGVQGEDQFIDRGDCW